MDNNFKNPFEADEEQLEMISLAPDKNPLPSLAYEPAPPVRSTPKEPVSPIQLSQHSMFDTFESSNPEQLLPQDSQEDPPLLQDIGIDPESILKRILAVLTFQKVEEELVKDPDLSGPFLISTALGVLLLLGGKLHFSDIEGCFLVGACLLYLLLNCLNRNATTIGLYAVMSFLGYSLLPMLFLALAGVFVELRGGLGALVGLVLAGWASWTAGGWLVVVLAREDSRWLVIYPLFLFYVSFSLIIIY